LVYPTDGGITYRDGGTDDVVDLAEHLGQLPPASEVLNAWDLMEFRPKAVAERIMAIYRRVGAK
jgi:hypothetical protein